MLFWEERARDEEQRQRGMLGCKREREKWGGECKEEKEIVCVRERERGGMCVRDDWSMLLIDSGCNCND